VLWLDQQARPLDVRLPPAAFHGGAVTRFAGLRNFVPVAAMGFGSR